MHMFALEIWKPFTKNTYYWYFDKAKYTISKRWCWASLEIKLILLLCLIKSASLMAFVYFPMKDTTRIALFDYFLFFQINSRVYAVSAGMSLTGVYLCYTLYFDSICLSTYRWANLYLHRNSTPRVQQSRWHVLKVAHSLPEETKTLFPTYLLFLSFIDFRDLCLLGTLILQVFCACFILTCEHAFLRYIYRFQELFSQEWLWLLVSSQVHMIVFFTLVMVCVHSVNTMTILFVSVTGSLFHYLDRTNQMLTKSQTSFNSSQFLHRNYFRFAINHTLLLREVLRVNPFFSKMYFLFLLVNLTSNAFMISTMVRGQMKDNMLYFGVVFVLFQFTAQTCGHYLIGMYNKKLHQSSRQLFSFGIAHRAEFGTNLRANLHLNHHIARFHTTKQYGITCGNFGVVTNQSLIKTCFYYCKFSIFAYHLWSR